MRLSYSAFSAFEICPKRYYFEYEERIPLVKDFRESAQGILVQKLIEIWLNEKKFLLGKDARTWLHNNLEIEYYKMWPGGYGEIGWSVEREKDVIAESHTLLDNFVDLVKTHKLLSNNIKSEVKIGAYIGDNRKIFGRMDIVFTKGGNHVILDGKATKSKIYGKKKEQLTFYALTYYHAFGIAPVVGFLYFKLNGTGDLQYLEYAESDLVELEGRIQQAFDQIQRKEFDANPSKSNCFWCPCKSVCQSYKDMVGGGDISLDSDPGEVGDILI